MSNPRGVLVLRRQEVARLLDLASCIDAVEEAFRLRGLGRVAPPGVLGTHVEGGAFHIKAGVLEHERAYYAAKVNANFPANPQARGLPTIQGVIVLADARDGRLLALIDSVEITAQRTAAATAIAARHLARGESRAATIIGCGVQGRAQLLALRLVLPIAVVFAYDQDGRRARVFTDELSALEGLEITAVEDLAAALARSDVVVTCTPSREDLLHPGDLRPGTFLAAVGADHPEKLEIDPRLMAGSKVVVDDLDQCAALGDLHHALEAGTMTRDDVFAELGEIVAGRKPGREGGEEITLFDSTGVAFQDVAAAAVVYERALAQNAGTEVAMGG